MTSGFATLHIAVTVLITAALSIPVAAALLRAPKAEAVTAALVAGLTTFGWRLAATSTPSTPMACRGSAPTTPLPRW